ncbi:MAG: methylated-DNA--[protein]-cysteine S-methyltransferase [Candidatus Izemoplasmatales bacterium]|nr:methylated-DNA--[protein]-cysteine S-methyltransferase [Candidatus Izemoplasmatales bacterium]MDD4988054.1 methylated-DNA--[protein]-cysteine S-methyltransferase [Candidatus Izemoplasmatales bacterium]NLF48919.1 methylated-DNA--[protein]-cysteine S-methyltransferase [Acholeplasmataceae bacterium]
MPDWREHYCHQNNSETNAMTIGYCQATPGTIAIRMEDGEVIGIDFVREPFPDIQYEANLDLKEVFRQLQAYFSGEKIRFTVPIRLRGTLFQLDIYRILQDIPYGQVVSYQELANRADHPRSWRAVGSALKHNPLPILLPCHRVIHQNGTIGAYQGGTNWKRWLLTLEGHSF